jgi:hypothetical protein
MLGAVGASLATLTDRAELTGVRLVFGLTTCLAAGFLYLLARKLFDSPWLGLAAPLALCALPAIAENAFSGPEAKAPALLFLVAMMWLALSERWLLAGVAAGMGCLTWQPLVVVAVAIAVAAWLRRPTAAEVTSPRARLLRFAAGFTAPLIASLVFFISTGSLDEAIDASLRFPLTGVQHGATGPIDRVQAIGTTLFAAHWLRGTLAILGFVALFVVLLRDIRRDRGSSLVARLRDPAVMVVLGPATVLLAFCLVDFQGTPDLIPLMPFSALGCAGLLSWIGQLPQRRAQLSLVGLGVGGLAAIALFVPSGLQPGLPCQRAQAMAVSRAAPGPTDLWAFGDPAVLVLSERRNPDRYVNLTSGMAAWKVSHDPGGLAGWMREIEEASPRIAVFGNFNQGDISRQLKSLFASQGYERTRIGTWTVYTQPDTDVPDSWTNACRRSTS